MSLLDTDSPANFKYLSQNIFTKIMSKSAPNDDRDDEDAVDTEHVENISDGCGCAEIWERLSEYRG